MSSCVSGRSYSGHSSDSCGLWNYLKLQLFCRASHVSTSIGGSPDVNCLLHYCIDNGLNFHFRSED